MGISGDQPKMTQLHKNTITSKMVVRGWYMTFFYRRDLLNCKKYVWGGFHNLSNLPRPIWDFLGFFFDILNHFKMHCSRFKISMHISWFFKVGRKSGKIWRKKFPDKKNFLLFNVWSWNSSQTCKTFVQVSDKNFGMIACVDLSD